jgi:hypothetical protein
MKRLFFISFLFFPLFCFAQFSSTEDEVRLISEDIVGDLNFIDFDKDLVILDFTDQNGTPTELGGYLADLVTNDVVKARRKFTVISREALQNNGKGKVLLDRALEVVEQGAATVYEQTGGSQTDLGKGAGTIATGANLGRKIFHPNASDNSLKGIKAILDGTISVVGDHYYLSLEVRDRKKGKILAAAEGAISNTLDLSRLHGSTLQAPTNGEDPQRNPTTNPGHTFERMHLKIELIKCKQNLNYLEVYFRVTSSGKDTELTTSRAWVKIFDQSDGDEFNPLQ